MNQRGWSPALALASALVAGAAGLGQAVDGHSTNIPPEIIFTHGVIDTGDLLNGGKPRIVTAMAIGGGKVQAVGSDEQMLRLAGPKTLLRTLNIAGQVFVFAGLKASNTHLGSEGRILMGQPSSNPISSAKGPVGRASQASTPGEYRRGIELAIAEELSRGVTSVQDLGDREALQVFEQLESEGKLNLRITEWLPSQAFLGQLIPTNVLHDAGDSMLHVEFLNGLADQFQAAGLSAKQQRGKLLPGYNADFILTDRDLSTFSPQKASDGNVLETYVAGRQAFVANMHIQ